ncbi:Vacuolar protein sorting-associated protein 13A [Auxenochlorella protothecoides]|uniref:Vacuolar protein sorting-associated protein 13A n=1 Tax=Auxenochlorella protothecoides TaxID=3075 RepID=A0A087SU30_AUXPR|nr:Vacuolar protein sorting-associated protein 13A [Auxenochlorella protothecoides]KFM29234.1 Vacuolar protein sorting-associated protein 13A [Auxenochlorella protothecoides]
MFEAQIAYYLNKYLGTYLEGIDPASLKISIYQGDVVLKNLRLKADALSELDLPVTVEAGLLGSLTLKVPWSALGQAPVEVRMDRLFLLAKPRDEADKASIKTADDVDTAFQSSKRQRVQMHESQWLAELERLEKAKEKAEGGGTGGGLFGGGRLKNVIDTVIGNLQLSITNIHVRYEDDVTNPGHPFSCGITLDKLAAATVNDKGEEAFVTTTPLSLLRKALDLRRAALYFDTDIDFWRPHSHWHDLEPVEWDEWFLPGVSSARQERGGTARHREYVLQPVGGRALYTRVGKMQTTADGDPRMDSSLDLESVALRLSHAQYQSYQLLLAEVQAGRTLSWRATVRFACLRRRYVSLYAKHLRTKGARMFARLVDLVGDQEEGLVYGSASPHSLLQRLRVGVGSASAELVGRDGRRVLRGGLDGIALELRKFPKTLAVGLRVAAMGVDSPEGVFVRTGRGLSAGTGGEGAEGAGSGEAGADGAEAGGAVADETPPPPEEEALTVTFVHAPQDGSADAEVGVVLRPSYVHYSAPTVARVAAFFRAPEALDFSNLQLAAGGQLERARKAAAAYAAAAMQARPRFNLRLQLDAPKIAVPVSDADGDVCLVLDLGQFVVSSDRGAPRGLSPDQAALYECVRLEGSDVAAFLVEGRHDWAAGGGDGVGAGEGGSGEQGAAGHTPRSPTAAPRPPRIPLLERCGLSVAAQLSRFPDPDRPAVRLQPAVPSLRFHLSPGRLRALLRGPLRVLRWTGLGRATETWAPARGVVTARGRLLLLDPEGGGGAAGGLAAVTLGADRRVLALAPGDARGVSHVVAVAPQGLEPADVLESTAAVLLRLEDGGAAEAWFRALCASQQALRELTGAGGATVPAPEWDDASSTVSGEDTMTASHDASVTSMPEDAPPAAQPAPTTLLQVDAELGELALFVAGRTPLVWWPPEDEDPVSPRTAAARAKAGFPAFVPDHVPHLAGESHIVVVRATGGTLGFVYGVPGMSVHTVLEALEVEDLLVGPRSPRQRYLACSGAEVGLAPDDDLFFDAAEDELRSVRSGELSVRRSASLASDAPARELAEFTFTIARPGTAGYAGVDTCLDVTLGTLRFYCNRPTLAALMSAGADFAAAAAGGEDGAGGDQEEPEAADAEELGAPSGVELAQAVDQSLAEKLEGSPEDPLATPVVRPGGASASPARRTVFRMRVALSTLAVSLNYEGAGARMLSTAAVEGFCFGLDVDARGVLSLTSRLGNAEVLDGTLPDPHPYRRACGLRGDGTASLVDVEFKMYPAGARADPRVPPGLAWAHLTARLSQLQLVFLYRLLAEHLSYVSVMLAMRLDQAGGVPLEEGRAVSAGGSGGATPRASTPRSTGSASRPATPLRGASSGPGRTASARTKGAAPPPLPLAEAQQPFVLVLEVEMDAPIIVLPRQSNSLDSLEVDLGNLSLSSKVVEVPGEECGKRGVQVLQEQAALAFSGMSCCVVQAGKRGGNVFKNQEQAWQLGWKRPLQPEARGPQPKFDLALDIPILRAVLDNGEYARITSIAAANVAEAPEPPEGLSAGIAPTEDVSPTNVRVVVSLARAELELHQLVEGVGEPQPLARFSIEDLGIAFHNTEEGSMAVSVCLPRVEGVDLRPEVPTSHNRVITSANKASFLIMEWSASPGMARQKLGVTLQKPELVVELSFLLATVAFVLPGLAVVGNHPIPYASQDFLLGGPDPPGPAGADLWLSPCARLLADRPGATEFEYDGGGHALILPPPSSLDEPLPLVLVGTGCTLRLRNLRLLHADSLALCLRLAPGARLLAEPRDGVELVEGAAAHAALAHALLPAPLQDNPTAAARAMGECLAAGEEAGTGGGEFQGDVIQGGVGFGGEGNTSDAPPTPPPCFEVSLSAVGIGLQLAQLDVAARSVHVLAATMDLGASVRLEGAAKAGRLALHGLHVESRTLDGEGADGEGARDGDAEGGQAAAPRSGSPDGKKRRRKKRRGSLDAPVLEPCHVSLDFELRGPGADPGSIVGSGTATTTTPLPAAEVTLAVSDLALNLAPDRVWSFVPGATLRADGGLVDLSVAGASGGVSVWRPRPSRAGYLPVGDVAVAEGAAPSFEVLAVAAGAAREEVRRALAPPVVDFARVWTDNGRVTAGRGVSVWRPVAPPGYASLGDCLVRGLDPPQSACVVRDSGPGEGPGAAGASGARQLPLLSDPQQLELVWQDTTSREDVRLTIWRPQPRLGYVAGGVNVVARIGKTRVLLRDAFRVPLLELDVGALDAGVQGPSPTVVQAYVGFSLSLWSHNGALRVWEPVVEPWNGIFICDANLGGRPAHGIKPGMHMSLKSSSEAVVTTLSYAAVSSLLAAHRDWQHVLVDNTLGIDAAMELDFGNRLEMVRLPAGHATRILRPLPSYAPRRRAAPAPDARPLDLLLVDVESLELEGDGLGRLRGARLYCTERSEQLVEGPAGPGALRAAWQVQRERSGGAAARHDAGLESAGQRALSVASQEGIWTVIPAAGARAGRDDAGRGSAVPVRLGAETLALESGVQAGARRETLRTLCVVRNTTALALEVALGEAPDADAGAGSAGNGAGVVEEVLEHQRWRPRVGWAGSNLHPRDPARFEHGTARRDDFPQVDPPRGWEWDSGWQLDRGSAGEKEGWVYAPDFSRVRFPAPDAGAYKPSPSDTVRVRRWVRRRVRAGSARRGLTPQASLVLEAPPAPRPPRVVGVVASGSTLPLPVGWDRSGSQLLLRPAPGECGGEEEGEAGEEEGEAGEGAVAEQKAGKRNSLAHSAGPPSHGWSEGAGAGTHTVLLDCLDESVTRLVRCAPLAGPDAGGGDTHGSQAEASISRAPPPASAAEASSLWFAVTLESSPLAEAGARDCEAPLDWRAAAAPPLTLVNQLPLAGSLLVWQEDPATGQLVSRQTLRVRSGQCAPVHGADLRSAVSFSFYPDGYEWMEAAPALAAAGARRAGAPGAALPDRVRLGRPGASLAVEVYVRRAVEYGPWLLHAAEEVDASEAAARGVPLSLTLAAPLWIANTTGLAMDVAVVAVAAPSRGASASPGASFSSRAARRDSGTARAPPPARGDLRRLVTDGGEGGGAARDLPAQRHVAPGSLELLSYPVPAWSSAGGGPGNDSVTASRSRAYGVRLRVAGSGWTPPLALEAGAAGASPGGDDSPLDGLEPVLVQARVREFGVTHEVVARLEVAPHAGSQILRLEPHVVVSNRTPLDVSLLHCAGLVERVAERGGAEVSAVILPRGASSFSAAPTTRSGQGAALRAGPGPRLVRPSAGLFVGDGGDRGAGGVQTSAGPDPLAAPAPPRLMATGALVSVHAAAPALVLPAGACAVPLHLPLASRRHEVCLRLGGGVTRDGPTLWSRPLTLRYPAEETLHVLAPCAAAGDGDARVALLRLSISRRAPGALLVVLESAGGDPPYSVENRSRVALQYRQAHVPGAPFHELAPFSATGWAWEHTLAGAAYRLELQEGAGEARAYALDAGAGVAGEGGGAAALDPLPLSVRPRSCAVVASYVEQTAAAPAGTARIEGDGPGGALGRGGVDRQLVVAPGAAGALTRSPRAALAPPPDRDLALQLEYLEVSITDAVPQELALVSLQRLAVNLAAGSTPAGTYRAATLALARIQVDDQLPGSRYPVVLAPAKGQGGDLPALQAAVTQHTGGARGHAFFPILAVRTPLVMQLAPDTAAADTMLRVRLLSISDLAAQVSFGSNPLARPRQVSGGAVSVILDLASFQAAAISLHGFELREEAMLHSAFRAHVAQVVQGQVFGVGVSLVRNFGVIGGAGKVLGMLSAGVAKLSQSRSDLEQAAAAPVPETKPISNFGDGFAEGAGAFGSSILRGLRGVVEKPREGARQRGFQGALSGVAKGLVGAVADPISGALDAMSATAQGMDAFMSKSKAELLELGRRRLPRVMSVDGAVTPTLRDGSFREARMEELGQALLQNTLLAARERLTRTGTVAERYEQHFLLPDNRVVVLTDRGILLLHAPGFDRLGAAADLAQPGRKKQRLLSFGAVARDDDDGFAFTRRPLACADQEPAATPVKAAFVDGPTVAEIAATQAAIDAAVNEQPQEKRSGGGTFSEVQEVFTCIVTTMNAFCGRPAPPNGYIAVSDVPPGEVSWRVSWEDLLALELRLSRESPDAEPDRLIVHRKGVAGRQQEESLAHQIKGYPNTPQASQIKMVAQAVYKRRYLEPLRSSALWSARHAAALGAAPPTAIPADMPHASALPLCLPCLEFAPAWHTNPARAPCVSFWRPLAPAGYRPAADVVCAGLEPPAEPFSLLWRSNARRAVAVWLPVAPRGYVALGAVVVGAPEAPSPEAYLCLREDLAAPARCSEAPTWRVSVWRVEGGAPHFLAVRAFARPPDAWLRAYAGEAGASR